MVTDVVTGSAVVGAPVVFNDAMFFGAANKLWKTDESGLPQTVADGAVSGLRKIGDQLFFSRKLPNGAGSLWSSDGSSEGTILVKQVALASIAYPADVNGQFMFVGSDGITGAELWRSDGTTEGTRIVKDLNPKRTGSSNARNFTSVGEKTFFVANDGAAGQELWVTDGAATHLVKDIVDGPTSSEIAQLTNLDGVLLFTVQGEQLWRSDGTLAGTYQLTDAEFGSYPSGSLTGGSNTAFVIANGVAYFAARTTEIGTALWRTDGTPAGTFQVKDINPTERFSWLDLGVNVNGVLYFAADDGVHGVELWRSDGSESGTSLVKDIRTDALGYGSYPTDFTNVAGMLYFVAADQDLGEDTDPNEEIWTSDGTSAGTHVVVELVPGPLGSAPDMLQNVGGTLFFLAAVTPDVHELWTTNGSAAGTHRFKETFFASHGPAVELNGLWYLAADDGVHGTELWVTDGVSAASLVQDIAPGATGSGVNELTLLNGKLYFRSDDGTIGPELWQSDGTSAGTMPVADLRVGSSGSLPTYLTAAGSRL
jgi:ELWxxDGT repeat protein